MKRILISIILIGVIYVLGLLLIEQINIYRPNATVILSSLEKEKLEQAIISRYSETDFANNKQLTNDNFEIVIKTDYINDDGVKDFMVTVESVHTCGSGGCLNTLYLQNEHHELKSVDFEFVVKKIDVLPSMTNQMHDLIINDDSNLIMVWDGQRYTMNTI